MLLLRLTKIQRSPYYRGLDLWDRLPLYIQSIESKVQFKNNIKTKHDPLIKSYTIECIS